MEQCDADVVDTSFFAIKTYDTNKDKEKNCKRVAYEVGSFLGLLDRVLCC